MAEASSVIASRAALKVPPNVGKAHGYRSDIDGLRAWAVIAVVLFHFGKLPNGYLGVDVFFVISGFLITRIIYREFTQGEFSIVHFYLRRIRRIVPLALAVSLMAFGTGVFLMLPDDLENLAQSVIATNFFSNNILQAITTRNYWNVVNEFKPLMHTWSLGVEEQYYFLYPILFLTLGKKRASWALPILGLLAAISLILFLWPGCPQYQKFYYIVFRFWELAVGGLVAIWFSNKFLEKRWAFLPLICLFLLLCGVSLGKAGTLVAAVGCSVWLVIPAADTDKCIELLLQHPLVVGVGKISFSLYMWHQVLLAFVRYAWAQDPGPLHLFLIFALTVVFSIGTYFLIEKPCRNKILVPTAALIGMAAALILLSSVASFYVYLNSGVLRDVPELGLLRNNVKRNVHAAYNERGFRFDADFTSSDKIKVLIIGDSFARDWINVLLESKLATDLEISYIADPGIHSRLLARSSAADVVFYTTSGMNTVPDLPVAPAKLWVVGTKNFGVSNGIFYNRRGPDYYNQRTPLMKGAFVQNQSLSKRYEGRYLDYLQKVISADKTVPVFTPDGQFISQDCRHLTKAGACYFAKLFSTDLDRIMDEVHAR